MKIYLDAAIGDISSSVEMLARVTVMMSDKPDIYDRKDIEYMIGKMRELVVIQKKLEAKRGKL